MATNKRKIVNDPVYGFIHINYDTIFDLIEHPWFQRLRRIRQLGLTHMVYPGAMHTRFQHALGAMHLMNQAIEVIRAKGHEITEQEAEGANIAILLHDIGHGPFSHALEYSLIESFTHEHLSLYIMEQLNVQMDGRLQTAIDIFRHCYPKKFLTQLVSGQLDMDRLDYLRRDSFFTGVSEGVIGSDRIIKMLNVVDDRLVVEAKGIYSIEKFLIARRLMYWQVYLHKTVLAAENLMVNILKRAKYLALRGEKLFATPALEYFLTRRFNHEINNHEAIVEMLNHFLLLDDSDILSAIKVWQYHSDRVLSMLCQQMNNRRLYKIELHNQPIDPVRIQQLRKRVAEQLHFSEEEAEYFVFEGTVWSDTYSVVDDRISILYNDGHLVDISEASDMLNIQVLSKIVKKYTLCYPKNLG
ncbi:MAG TPA: HD domain-containing protein [Bacteroidales bacterium]|nr:HD domain-containing protein [Bacteroidales bacterium]HPO65037.1 HD domain-containing protein [Bacteroidales bacterium]